MMNRVLNGVPILVAAISVLLAGACLMLEACDSVRVDGRAAVVAQGSAGRGLVGSGVDVHR